MTKGKGTELPGLHDRTVYSQIFYPRQVHYKYYDLLDRSRYV